MSIVRIVENVGFSMYMERQLRELSNSELIKLQMSIKKILDERSIDEDTIKAVIKKLSDIHGGLVRYTDVTKYLEGMGFKRDAIARKIVDMWMKNPSIAHGGCPIGESESEDNPIYPYVDGEKFHQICYLLPR